MTNNQFTDLAVKMTDQGYFDFYIDEETGDLATTNSFDSAYIISFFTDNRADESEVADPLARRGWIGNPYCDIEGGYGSKYWLYEQHRIDGHLERSLYFETLNCLDWLIQGGFATAVDATVIPHPAQRGMQIQTKITWPDGGISSFGWDL